MTYQLLKSLHLFSMVVLFGVGLGSAFYKWMADRSGVLPHIDVTNRTVVLADWIFTTPTILIQPVTGAAMVVLVGFDAGADWLIASVILYLVAGGCWIPVVFLQIRMRNISRQAVENGRGLPSSYWRYARVWFWLGVPAFGAMVGIVLLMVFKPSLGAI